MSFKPEEKNAFILKFQKRTKQLAIDIIRHCRTFPKEAACNIVIYQIIKSATSTGANYRAACRARSKKEFFAKLSITVEEADETEYWLSMILEMNLSIDYSETKRLQKEAMEITKVLARARMSAGKGVKD